MFNYSNPYQLPLVSPQMMQAPQVTQAPQMTQTSNTNIFVNGPDSAMQFGYRMGPGRESPPLFDSNGKMFYIVTTDGAGTPTLETFDFCKHVAPPTEVGDQYVSRNEFDNAINQLKEAINGIHGSLQSGTAPTTQPGQPATTS